MTHVPPNPGPDSASMRQLHSAPAPRVVIDGREYLYFAGTGYLGLQNHPELVAAACDALRKYGTGSATSRASWGTTPPVSLVEQTAAQFFGVEGAFYYASGYVGNAILARAMRGTYDLVLTDELCHYSILDAASLVGCPIIRFRHRDADDLQTQLRNHVRSDERPLVLTDGVFPISGRIAPLLRYYEVLCQFPGSALCVDDAHGLGVLGEMGRGSFESCGLSQTDVNARWIDDPPATTPHLYCCGTLSKAVGGYGGIIAGSADFIACLKERSHFYSGASAPSVADAAASAAGLKILIQYPELRQRLTENVGRLKRGLERLGIAIEQTPVPIVGVSLGSAQNMQRLQRELAGRGMLIAYFPTYSGAGAEGSLRIAIFATHEHGMIDHLLENLKQLIKV